MIQSIHIESWWTAILNPGYGFMTPVKFSGGTLFALALKRSNGSKGSVWKLPWKGLTLQDWFLVEASQKVPDGTRNQKTVLQNPTLLWGNYCSFAPLLLSTNFSYFIYQNVILLLRWSQNCWVKKLLPQNYLSLSVFEVSGGSFQSGMF